MKLTRRESLRLVAGGAATASLWGDGLRGYAAGRGAQFKVGVTDWNLKLENKPEAVALAKKLGFEGVQISLGKGTDHLPLADPALQQTYLAESKRVGLPLASVCLEVLHRNVLKSDPLGLRFVAESIPAARALGVKVVLLPFFGKGALTNRAEMDYVGQALREVAPDAEKAGVILGLEDTISARDNVSIMERTKSPAVLTYYDVGNSTKAGFNVVEEIRWLGADRICEMHLKDNPGYLGKGTIDFPAVVDALADIGFKQWAQLETDTPSGSVEADMATNLAYIRGVMARRNRAAS
jgi:sugar phosphate isomerase/epimerase